MYVALVIAVHSSPRKNEKASISWLHVLASNSYELVVCM